ncbi:MAG: dihydroorotase [Methanobacteriota archaeon]|nr:MAG: dihydroorotase [Euryarchaeota archaeon]
MVMSRLFPRGYGGMVSGNLLIRGSTMVLGGKEVEGDLRVTSGIISAIAPGGGLEPGRNETVIEAEGLHLLPGAIDPHVHFRDPGQPEKEDLESGSRAAAAGGVTSFLDMPNNIPNATNRKTLENKIHLAGKKAVTHHGFFVGATRDNVSDLQSVEGMDGVCGIKIFMGSSTGDLLVDEQRHLEDIFANTGGIIATHAEDEERLNQRISEFGHRTDIASHAECRDVECAFLATKRAAALAKDHDHRLHIVHLTSAKEADWLTKNKGNLITTEVCTQHLTFDQDDVRELGVRVLMNPPIRYTEDRETLWQRLKDGTIDCVVTDHAPHTLESKSVGYPKAPAGMPGVETSLPLMLTHAMNGKCSVADVVKWMCEGPARVYGIQNKGSLIVGYDGDLTLVNLQKRWTITDSDTWTRVGWTPYSGMALTGWPMYTIVDGNVVHKRDPRGPIRGIPVASPGSVGRALRFEPLS